MSLSVVIIGAGVIGLTCGIRILESVPSVNVSIVAETLPGKGETCSEKAAAIWGPHYFAGDMEMIDRISRESLQVFLGQMIEANSEEKYGITMTRGYEFFYKGLVNDRPFWADFVPNFKFYPSKEHIDQVLEHLPITKDPQWVNGLSYTVPSIDMRVYQPWLLEKFLSLGGEIHQQKLSSIDEASLFFKGVTGKETKRVVINCSGHAARILCNDLSVQGRKGVVVLMHAPWITECYCVENGTDKVAYVIPLKGGQLVCGGTTVASETEGTEDLVEGVIERCIALVPSLAKAKVINAWAGLRPFRSKGIRIELDKSHSTSKSALIHCYGHGGSGVTISWGSANTVVKILSDWAKSPSSKL